MQFGVLFFYTFCSFFNDQLIIYFSDHGKDVAVFYALSIFTVVEFLLFSFFLYLIIKKKIFKVLILASLPVFLSISIFSFYIANPLNGFDSIATTVEIIFVLAFCVFFLFQELNNPNTLFIYQNSNFWFVFGILMYLAGNFFLFLQASGVSAEDRDAFWSINFICNIIKNLLFALAFYLPKNNQKQSAFGHHEEFGSGSLNAF